MRAERVREVIRELLRREKHDILSWESTPQLTVESFEQMRFTQSDSAEQIQRILSLAGSLANLSHTGERELIAGTDNEVRQMCEASSTVG